MHLTVPFVGGLWFFFCVKELVYMCVRVCVCKSRGEKKVDKRVQALVLCQFGLVSDFGVCLAAAARVPWQWLSPCWSCIVLKRHEAYRCSLMSWVAFNAEPS